MTTPKRDEVEAVALDERTMREHIKGRQLPHPLSAYWIGVDGKSGPVGYEWSDKPHRLVFDLIGHILYLEAAIAALDESRARDKQDEAPDPLKGFEQYEKPNWDGYNADPISAETTRAARALAVDLAGRINPPHIAPGADGSVGFEWIFEEGAIKKVFVDIGPGTSWSAYQRFASGSSRKIARGPLDESAADKIVALFAAIPPSEIITPAPSQSDAIRAEVIAQGVDPNSDQAERMSRAMRRNMLRKARE